MQRELTARFSVLMSIFLVALLFSSFAHANLVFNSRTGSIDFNTAATIKMRVGSDGNFLIIEGGET